MIPLITRTGGRPWSLLVAVLFLSLVMSSNAWSVLTDYTFSETTGAPTDMTGSTQVTTQADDAAYGVYDIGFTFYLEGIAYTQFSVNSNGLMKLGGARVSGARANEDFPASAPGAADYPFLAPLWDDLYVVGSGLRYKVTGTAPNRILTVEWNAERYPMDASENTTLQVRLYEGSNKFEYWYGATTGAMGNFDAFIGVAENTTNFLRVVPGPPAQVHSSGNSEVRPPDLNTLYVFECSRVTFAGNTEQGGTTGMANLDSLFLGQQAQRGGSAIFKPFAISSIGCASADLTFTVTGQHASDYQIDQSSTTITSGGSFSPTITFAPLGIGRRYATLTITGTGGTRTYYLAAEGTTRINIAGNIEQGGTAAMKEGDTLLKGKSVPRFRSASYTPLTVTNVSDNGELPPATVTYRIAGASGQYSIDPSSASLGVGESHTPVITFNATGIGAVVDTLIVNAEGAIYRYVLRAFSEAPGGTFMVDAEPLGDNTRLFTNSYSCVGTEVVSIPVTVTNIGFGPLTLSSVEFYQTDTTYGQGMPGYPFRRDAMGRLIPSRDYLLTTRPVVAPMTPAQLPASPIQVAAGETRTLYLTFVGQAPGKRFARAYIRTNAENLFGGDTTGETVMGVITFDLFGRGVGSTLADNINGGLPKAITFEQTYLGESRTSILTLVNPGICTLRVDLDQLTIARGDIEEFQIVGRPDNLIDAATNDLLIPPGKSDTVVIRFMPKHLGSRRAGLLLKTNDSSFQIPGITERGAYYVDLYGTGRADLYASGAQLGQALIGGGSGEHRRGAIRMENTRPTPVTVISAAIEGADMMEFSAAAWPAMPFLLNAGQAVELGVVFAPMAGGQVGDRNARVRLITAEKDTIVASLHGVAGTRVASVSTPAINFGALTIGKQTRQSITITNTGTMPLRLEQPVLSPGSDFVVGTLPRLELAPGQVEYLEITYAPSGLGASNATLTINNNGTTGAVVVNLSGAGLKTKFVDADPGRTARSDYDESDPLGSNHAGMENGNGNDGMNVSGVEGESTIGGMTLLQNVPNPARDLVAISYRLAKGAEVELGLYDGQGRLVRVLESGYREGGERVVRVNVADLPNGVYHYRLTSEGRSLSRTLSIVR